MDLRPSADQLALRDSADKLLRERYTPELRKTPGAFRETLAAQGWLGVTIAEEDGGLGLGMVEACLLADAMGRHLCREAFATHIYVSTLVAALPADGARHALLSELAAGRAFAVADPFGAIKVARDSAGARLSGSAAILDFVASTPVLAVASLNAVDHLLRIDDTTDVSRHATVDGRTAGRLPTSGLPAVDLGQISTGALGLAADRAVAIQSADIAGAMRAVLDATTAYTKTRAQFGQAIGANQVVKHRLVDMAVRCEEATSLATRAAIRTGDGSDVSIRSRAVSGAKAKVAAMARAVMEDAVQLHGGMGVTDELDIGWYLKRALAFDASFGTPRWHRERYGALRPASVA